MAKSLVKQYLTAAGRERVALHPLTATKKHFYYQKYSCQVVHDSGEPGAWDAPPLNRCEVTFLLSKIIVSSST